MQITNKDDIKIGYTYYEVSNNNIETITFSSLPYEKHSCSWWCDIIKINQSTMTVFKGGRSLMDMNVEPNQYNDHKLFDDINEAYVYLISEDKPKFYNAGFIL